MKNILIHSSSGGNNKLFDSTARDACNDPFIYLREHLSHLGYDLLTSDNNAVENCERVLFFDVDSAFPYRGLKGELKRTFNKFGSKHILRDLYSECMDGVCKNKMALFLWEAKVICPENWDIRYHNNFPIIFTWNDALVDNKKYFKIFCPQTRTFPPIPSIPFSQKKLLVNISGNKSSNHPNELYTGRREAIEYFQNNQPDNFDLYGVGWNQPLHYIEHIFPLVINKYSSYKGSVRHKWEIFPHYRFSLCYENTRNETGYITEKIFDSMRAGCVPVYWGASNIKEYVDEETFIDRRKFNSNAELEDYLLRMSEREYMSYQDAIQFYLGSERFARFLPPAFADTVVRVLGL